jgi:hypothetical protein
MNKKAIMSVIDPKSSTEATREPVKMPRRVSNELWSPMKDIWLAIAEYPTAHEMKLFAVEPDTTSAPDEQLISWLELVMQHLSETQLFFTGQGWGEIQIHPQNEEDQWILTTDQMIFMLQYHNPIEAAYENDDMEYLRSLAASEEYKSIFGDMSFDEAYDRYECMLEDDSADT